MLALRRSWPQLNFATPQNGDTPPTKACDSVSNNPFPCHGLDEALLKPRGIAAFSSVGLSAKPEYSALYGLNYGLGYGLT